MIRTTLAALTALTLTSIPAVAHETHKRDMKPTWQSQQVKVGSCQFFMSEWNMQKIERTFRAMPQSTRMNLQHVLRHAGLYNGSDDGIWGTKTECAFKAVASRFHGEMTDADMIQFFEYMLDEGFVLDYPGTPNAFPHPGTLY
jgi:hypothetical protein